MSFFCLLAITNYTSQWRVCHAKAIKEKFSIDGGLGF